MSKLYPGKAFSPPAILVDNIGEADSIIKVSDVSAFPDAPNYATIGTDENGETIIYTAKTADSLSGCQRGVEGTAKAWSAGELIARNFTAADRRYQGKCDRGGHRADGGRNGPGRGTGGPGRGRRRPGDRRHSRGGGGLPGCGKGQSGRPRHAGRERPCPVVSTGYQGRRGRRDEICPRSRERKIIHDGGCIKWLVKRFLSPTRKPSTR